MFRHIAELIVGVLPDAREGLIPGTAHDPQETHPGAYVDALEMFAAGLAHG